MEVFTAPCVAILEGAKSLGFSNTGDGASLPDGPWDAVIDASHAREAPALAIALVGSGRRVVCVGLARRPRSVDARILARADVTAVGPRFHVTTSSRDGAST